MEKISGGFPANGKNFPPPEHNAEDEAREKSVKMLSPLQRQILLYLRQNPSASRRQIKSELPKTTDNIIKYNLAQLQKMGLLKHNGANHGGEWIVFIDN